MFKFWESSHLWDCSQSFAVPKPDTYGLLMCFNRLLIVSNLSLWNELLRLTPVISLSIFTPTTFFKEQENTLSRCSRQKLFPIPLWLYTMQAHPASYPPHQRLLFLPHLSWTPWKHPVVQGCFTLSSTRYSNDRLLFMRPKLQFNCFETLSLWSPRAPRSNYMDFMTKCKQKKKIKIKRSNFLH